MTKNPKLMALQSEKDCPTLPKSSKYKFLIWEGFLTFSLTVYQLRACSLSFLRSWLLKRFRADLSQPSTPLLKSVLEDAPVQHSPSLRWSCQREDYCTGWCRDLVRSIAQWPLFWFSDGRWGRDSTETNKMCANICCEASRAVNHQVPHLQHLGLL